MNPSARSKLFSTPTKKTAAFYDSQKRLATEHAVFDDTGHHDPVREPASDTVEGLLLSNFTLIRLGAAQKAYNDPAKRALLAQKEELERKIDTLKYQKLAMSQDDYKNAAYRRAPGVGEGAGSIRQVKPAYQFAAICAALLVAASAVWPARQTTATCCANTASKAKLKPATSRSHSAGDPYLRAEGYWGLENYEQANNEFRLAVAQNDKSALYRVRWGMLLHERFNNTDAEGLFKEALQRDPKNARAYLGLALVSADGFDSKAIDWASSALAIDPKLVEAHELMAKLALEDSQTDEAIRQADDAIRLSQTLSTRWRFTRPWKCWRTARPIRGSRKSAKSIRLMAKPTQLWPTTWC